MNGSKISPLALGAIALAFVVALALPQVLGRYGLEIASTWVLMSIAAVGLNLTLGYAGQISLAQGAFVGIGAYAAGLMTTNGIPLPVACIGVVLLCFVVGWILGYPALRVQHHYLAFVTLAFSTLAYLAFRNEQWLTGGVYGLSNIPRPEFFGFRFRSPQSYFYLCFSMLVLVLAGTWWLVQSPWGRAFMALRENPIRALSLGIDTRRYTLLAFAIGSAIGGFSGALYAPLVGYIDPAAFTLGLSFSLLLMVIVGGQGFFLGPLLGALIAVMLPEWLRFAKDYYLIIYAALVMVLLIISPTGILGILDNYLTGRKTRAASAMRAAAKSTLADAPTGGQK